MCCKYKTTFGKQKNAHNGIFFQILTDIFVKFISVDFSCNLVAFFLFCNLKYYIKLGKKCNTGERRKAIAYLLERNFSVLGVYMSDCS